MERVSPTYLLRLAGSRPANADVLRLWLSVASGRGSCSGGRTDGDSGGGGSQPLGGGSRVVGRISSQGGGRSGLLGLDRAHQVSVCDHMLHSVDSIELIVAGGCGGRVNGESCRSWLLLTASGCGASLWKRRLLLLLLLLVI